MDELLIEDKKYISSKQAAKVTGYAKDYIGQLCREGRMPARLVGRNWYVLETAVRDHRFGGETSQPASRRQQERGKSQESQAFVSAGWESPRYSPSTKSDLVLGEPVPLEDLLSPEEPEPEASAEVSHQKLQETWKAWFEQVASIASTPITMASEEVEKANIKPEEPNEPPETPEKSDEEVRVPIRTVYRHPPKELLPDRPKEVEEKAEESPRRRGRRMAGTVYLSGAIVAACTLILALLGTGYLDKYIESDKRASLLAGVVVYEIDR